MDIWVRGPHCGEVRPSRLRDELLRATAFLVEYLDIPSAPPSVDIHVVVYRRNLIIGQSVAYCMPIFYPGDMDWTMEIGIVQRKNKRWMLDCLSHEMIHVKQYAFNELSYDYSARHGPSQSARCVWRGKHYKQDTIRQPWEKEAWGRTQELSEAVLEQGIFAH